MNPSRWSARSVTLPRMGRIAAITAAVAATAMMFGAGPAHAGPGNPSDMGLPDDYHCQSDPIFGLNPTVRLLCDSPVAIEDGVAVAWVRYRTFTHIGGNRTQCRGRFDEYGGYHADGCELSTQYSDPTTTSQIERYVVVADAIPEGEPGHIE